MQAEGIVAMSNSASSPVKPKSRLAKFLWCCREVVCLIVWAYLVTKLLLVDLDAYLAAAGGIALHELMPYRLVGLMVVAALYWICVGNRRFATDLAYVVLYPFVVLLWKIPVFAARHWAVTIAMAPLGYEALIALRARFAALVLALVCGLFILTSHDQFVLAGAMALLGFTFLAYLCRCLGRAGRASAFSSLAEIGRRFRNKLESDSFGTGVWEKLAEHRVAEKEEKKLEGELSLYYTISCGFDYVAEKLHRVSRSRKIDLWVMGGWFLIVLVTTLIYALQYFALSKIDPGAFLNASGGFWGFLGFSFGKLTPSSVSLIAPGSFLASLLCYSQLGVALVILVILFFTFSTSVREANRESMDEFIAEVRTIAETVEQQFLKAYDLALPQVEQLLLHHNAELVNGLRRWRGKPELKLGRPFNEGNVDDKLKAALPAGSQ